MVAVEGQIFMVTCPALMLVGWKGSGLNMSQNNYLILIGDFGCPRYTIKCA